LRSFAQLLKSTATLSTKHSDYTRRAGKSNRSTRRLLLQSIDRPNAPSEWMTRNPAVSSALLPFYFSLLTSTRPMIRSIALTEICPGGRAASANPQAEAIGWCRIPVMGLSDNPAPFLWDPDPEPRRGTSLFSSVRLARIPPRKLSLAESRQPLELRHGLAFGCHGFGTPNPCRSSEHRFGVPNLWHRAPRHQPFSIPISGRKPIAESC
jgi:hypothetical protein